MASSLTGDFQATMVLSLGLSLLGVISVAFLPKTSRLQIPDWEDAIPSETRSTTEQSASHAD